MKILVVANYILSHQESMQRFAKVLEEGLLAEGYEVRVIRPEVKLCKSDQAEYGLSKWLGYIDRFFLFRWQLRQAAKWADIVHICDHSNAMYSSWVDVPSLVTCHDLMAIRSGMGLIKDNKTGFAGKMLQKWIVYGLSRCTRIACVSENTQMELIDTLGISIEKTFVAYNALNYPYSPMSQSEAWTLIKRRLPCFDSLYFFHLGGNQWYKNRKGLLEIYSNLIQYSEYKNHKLILAGKPWTDELTNKIKALGVEGKVVEISNLTNEEVRAFYSAAEALIFPSLQEGFGWPIAEAQACGCKVITTGRAPMTEVGGGAAIYIDPEIPAQAAELIHEELPLGVDSASDSIENARRFSIDSMVGSYRYGYEQVTRNYR